jgi:hypothetical protein
MQKVNINHAASQHSWVLHNRLPQLWHQEALKATCAAHPKHGSLFACPP